MPPEQSHQEIDPQISVVVAERRGKDLFYSIHVLKIAVFPQNET